MGGHYLHPEEARWFVEYQAIRHFGWSHEEYMNTPGYALQWLMGIAHIENQIEEERQRKAEAEARR
jgi:hypothetical protein